MQAFIAQAAKENGVPKSPIIVSPRNHAHHGTNLGKEQKNELGSPLEENFKPQESNAAQKLEREKRERDLEEQEAKLKKEQ